MRIALFHCQLKSDDISDAIVNSVRFLLARFSELAEIRLVTGFQDTSTEVLEKIRMGFDRHTADKLRLDILEELACKEKPHEDAIGLLITKLESRYGDDTLWWVHNYHCEINPIFTAGLMKIAETGRRNILLHIHDFPECGRYESLTKLNAALANPPYPSGPRIRYAVINERDRQILSDAGLRDSVHMLMNPVSLKPVEPTDTVAVRGALEKHGHQYGFLPAAPILLYPGEACRKKNILEAALVTRLLDEQANLIVTRPASQDEVYSDIVKSAYLDGLISGFWCPSSIDDGYGGEADLAQSCNAIISTSIEENSGKLFLDALHWQKPLLARYVGTIDGILEFLGDYPRRFWADLRIPADPELANRTKEAYKDKINAASSLLPGKSLKPMLSAVSKLASGGGIDMSYLAVNDQIGALQKAKNDKIWLEETRALNKELLDSLSRTIQATPPAMDDALISRFGEAAYMRSFFEIFKDFGANKPTPNPIRVQEYVSKSFGRIDHMRLLYDI